MYECGPPPLSETRPVPSRPVRASGRKSTGYISSSKQTRKPGPLLRRRSAESAQCFYASDSSLTPLPSSDDEDDGSFMNTAKRSRTQSPSPGGSAVLDSTTDPQIGHLNGHSFGSIDQGISGDCPPLETHMDFRDELPPTPPETPSASLTDVIRGDIDDPMNGTSISAGCLRFGKGQNQSMTSSNHPKSLSAPVPPPSSSPRRKRKKRINYYTKKKPPKQKKAEPETTEESMVIDPPAVADPRLRPSGLPSLEISIASIPSISRVPLSASRTNVTPLRSASASGLNPPLDEPKGLGDTPTGAVPGLSRPTLPSNPPIWAQVRSSCQRFT